MPNKSRNAYSLVTLCPIKSTIEGDGMSVYNTRKILQDLPTGVDLPFGVYSPVSPMAKVSNTYLARFFILDDLIFQSHPYHLDNLKSKYLVFTANIYGDLDKYLTEMYKNIEKEIKDIWRHCIGFEHVNDSESFKHYIKKCQVKTTFFFNGSTDDPLEEQLKSLYIKQEFSKFVFAHQGASAGQILADYKEFCTKHNPSNVHFPTWKAGFTKLEGIEQYQTVS